MNDLETHLRHHLQEQADQLDLPAGGPAYASARADAHRKQQWVARGVATAFALLVIGGAAWVMGIGSEEGASELDLADNQQELRNEATPIDGPTTGGVLEVDWREVDGAFNPQQLLAMGDSLFAISTAPGVNQFGPNGLPMIVLRSDDGGATWDHTGDLPDEVDGFFSRGNIVGFENALFAISTAPGVAEDAVEGIVWRSDNNGEDWVETSLPSAGPPDGLPILTNFTNTSLSRTDTTLVATMVTSSQVDPIGLLPEELQANAVAAISVGGEILVFDDVAVLEPNFACVDELWADGIEPTHAELEENCGVRTAADGAWIRADIAPIARLTFADLDLGPEGLQRDVVTSEVFVSTNGIDFDPVPLPNEWQLSGFAGTGGDGVYAGNSFASVVYSADGLTWQEVPSEELFGVAGLGDVASLPSGQTLLHGWDLNGENILLVGDMATGWERIDVAGLVNAGPNTDLYVSDLDTGLITVFHSSEAGADRIIEDQDGEVLEVVEAVEQRSTILVSGDGVTWQPVESPGDKADSVQAASTIVGNDLLVVVAAFDFETGESSAHQVRIGLG